MNGTDREKLLARFWAKVNKTETCWLWTGGTSRGSGEPYGSFHPSRSVLVRAHVFAYEMLVGPVPLGLVLDHLCRVRMCCNPAHLEPVTPQVNVLRGIGPTAINAAKTHCDHGHEFTPENTGEVTAGGRYCKACAYEANLARRKANPEANRTYQREWARRKREANYAAGLSSTGKSAFDKAKSVSARRRTA